MALVWGQNGKIHIIRHKFGWEMVKDDNAFLPSPPLTNFRYAMPCFKNPLAVAVASGLLGFACEPLGLGLCLHWCNQKKSKEIMVLADWSWKLGNAWPWCSGEPFFSLIIPKYLRIKTWTKGLKHLYIHLLSAACQYKFCVISIAAGNCFERRHMHNWCPTVRTSSLGCSKWPKTHLELFRNLKLFNHFQSTHLQMDSRLRF